MIRELLEAQRARKSEKLSAEQAGLFEELWRKPSPEGDVPEDSAAHELPEPPAAAGEETRGAATACRATSRASASCMIWRNPRNTAAAAAGTCG